MLYIYSIGLNKKKRYLTTMYSIIKYLFATERQFIIMSRILSPTTRKKGKLCRFVNLNATYILPAERDIQSNRVLVVSEYHKKDYSVELS
jgi:hypothetical protein